MTKEQAEEAAQALERASERVAGQMGEEARVSVRRAAHALRAFGPMLEALETACATTECASLFPPDHPVEHLRGQELLWHKLAVAALALARKEP
jgi:hypothetical protein